MTLSCDCSWNDDSADWYWRHPNDYSELTTPRRRRCCSCNTLINLGSVVTKFHRYRSANSEIEENIYGDEVPLASWYMCEECSDLYYTFTGLNFCIDIGDDMHDYPAQYNAMRKFL